MKAEPYILYMLLWACILSHTPRSTGRRSCRSDLISGYGMGRRLSWSDLISNRGMGRRSSWSGLISVHGMGSSGVVSSVAVGWVLLVWPYQWLWDGFFWCVLISGHRMGSFLDNWSFHGGESSRSILTQMVVMTFRRVSEEQVSWKKTSLLFMAIKAP